MNNNLKIFALEYVKLHDNLTKEQKLGVGRFIVEANDDQINFLLLTGEVKDKLTKEDKSLIETSDFSSGFDKGFMHGAEAGAVGGIVVTLAATAVLAAATAAGIVAYKRFFSKAARACKDKGGIHKTSCMNKFKRQGQAARIKALQAGMVKCAKTKDPAKCKSKLQGKINKEKAKMGAL
jgi:hypothetical protein